MIIFYLFLSFREDGEKSYGVAVVFYEEVKDVNICHAVHILQVRPQSGTTQKHKMSKLILQFPENVLDGI